MLLVMRGKSLIALVLAFNGACLAGGLAGCSDGATSKDQPADAATVEDAAAEVADTSAPDTAVVDSTTDTGTDAPVDTGAKVDTGTPVDTGVGEAGGVLFSCGTATCSSSFQYCSKARAPGICPKPDSGVCPAGCPGCPPLPLTCETMPAKCWAKASCACLLVEVCGSATAGTCTEATGGGFTVACMGV